jgi:hypothetical protein
MLRLLIVILGLTCPAVIGAQQASPLAPGARVRVRIAPSGRHHTGTLLSLRNDTLTLDRAGRDGAIALPLTDVTQLERSLGPGRCRTRGARLECAVLGTLTGAVVGGAILYQLTTCTECDSSGIGVLLGVPAGAVLGLLVGLYVGGERWERLPVPGATAR